MHPAMQATHPCADITKRFGQAQLPADKYAGVRQFVHYAAFSVQLIQAKIFTEHKLHVLAAVSL